MIHQRHRRTDGQTDGRTDGQTTCDSKTALCTAVHRAVKTECSKCTKLLTHVARGHDSVLFAGGVTIRYVLPVLLVTSCLQFVAMHSGDVKRRMFKVTHYSLGGSTDSIWPRIRLTLKVTQRYERSMMSAIFFILLARRSP